MDGQRPRFGGRIAAMAELLPMGARVADVGTDHGRLLIAAVTSRAAPLAIGVDLRVDPLAEARRTIARLAPELRDRIVLRRGNGLAPVADDEVDAIVIAGMGGDRITEILAADAGRVTAGRVLVLQPTAHWPRLREFLAASGITTTSESLAHDRGRDHLVVGAIGGPARPALTRDEAAAARPGPRPADR